MDDVGGGGDGPQRADGGMQRGELAVAPHEGTHAGGGIDERFQNHEAGSAGYAAGGSSADVGWGEHEESEERAG